MTTIFLNESGYTGPDFLHPSQPIFTLATLNLDEPTSIDLKRDFFGTIKAKELKHSAMSK